MEFFGLVLKCYQTQKLINLWALFLQRTACTSSLAWGTVLLTELFIHCVIIMKDSYFTLYSVASCCYIVITLLSCLAVLQTDSVLYSCYIVATLLCYIVVTLLCFRWLPVVTLWYFAVLQMATCCYIVDNLLCYRRILCFESSRSGVTPQKSVQAIFKALVPACSLFEDGVVISPLLSTGNQVIKSLCVNVMYMYVSM